jgi:hypothetical protein
MAATAGSTPVASGGVTLGGAVVSFTASVPAAGDRMVEVVASAAVAHGLGSARTAAASVRTAAASPVRATADSADLDRAVPVEAAVDSADHHPAMVASVGLRLRAMVPVGGTESPIPKAIL